MTDALISAISLTAFRGGARWAWFTLWLMPIQAAFAAAMGYASRQPGEAVAPPFYSGSLFAVLTIVWLALSYRKYLSNGNGG